MKKNFKTIGIWMFLTIVYLMVGLGQPNVVLANEIKEASHELFDFGAFIKDDEIKDGTAPFDKEQKAGYDTGDSNGIVRTFDNVTYPLKVTVNPKKNSSLKNIKLRITGELNNAIDDNRVNAVFSSGKTDMANGKVTLNQEYTIQETGNSVMIPIVVETKGAKNGTVIQPKITVQVISVDGKDIAKDNVKVNFGNLPKVTISGAVNLGAKFGGVYGTNGILESSINPNVPAGDLSMVHGKNVTFFIKPLAGKTNMVGSTFPEGKLNYRMEMSGRVSWDNGKTESLDFLNKNKPVEIFSFYNINRDAKFQGTPNTISEKLGTYVWRFSNTNGNPRSKITNLTDENVISKESRSAVWDSGEYSISKPKNTGKKIELSGSNQNFVIGSTYPMYRADNGQVRAMNENEYAFSTQGILFKTANEYYPKYGLNQVNEHNNVYYDVKIYIDSYEDKDGKVHSLNTTASMTFSERNNPAGSYSLQNAFFTMDGRELGTPDVGWSWTSKGDATLIKGQDVNFVHALYTEVFSLGGYKDVIKWNTDSFELTAEYAKKNEDSYKANSYTGLDGLNAGDRSAVTVYFGIAKSDSSSFKAVTHNGKDDYTWYKTYDEAKKHGEVGAMMKEVKAKVGNRVVSSPQTWLKVKTDKIGSLNSKGTPNVCATQAYMYPNEDRSVEYQVRPNNFKGYTEYDELGNLIKMQDPVGNTVNFETLGIINAEVSTSISTDKNTYYTTDKVSVTTKTGLKVPEAISFTDGEKVQIKQLLPKGLLYDLGSSKLGKETVEPKIRTLLDGTSELVWEYFLSAKNKVVPDITYNATINPIDLEPAIQNNLSIKSSVSSSLDTRAEKFRTSTKEIKIVKIGMVGISEKVEADYGEKNSDYTLILKPYTTIDDEAHVKGISVLPYNSDTLGSKFSGKTWLKDVTVSGNKKVEVWLNNKVITTNNPNEVDLTTDGWYKYQNGAETSEARTVLFHVDDILGKADKVELKYKMGTQNNKFRDEYLNKTVINSGSDYKLSPESNRVKYTIRADVELGMKKIQIFTAKSDVGLPVKLIVEKNFYNDRSNNLPVTVAIYEKDSRRKVAEKTYKVSELPENIEMKIPKEFLKKNTSKNYEAVFEGYNDNFIGIIEGQEKVDTEGYTSSEQHLTNATDAGDILYSGVVMTEREVHQEMNVFRERLRVPKIEEIRTKSGYGIELNRYKAIYQNELKNMSEITTRLKAENAIVEETLGLSGPNGYKYIDMTEKDIETSDNRESYTFSYELPNVLVRQGDGKVFQPQDREQAESNGKRTIDGGKKLYIPIWIDNLGIYHVYFESSDPLGANQVTFSLDSKVSVYAFMYATIGSESIEKDELLLEPVYPDGTQPEGWIQSEIDWLKQ